MVRRISTLSFAAGGFLGVMALPVAAQDQAETAPPPASPTIEPTVQPKSINTATIDKIMEQAVRNISRRYNLNEEQRKKTDEIMRRDVLQFLREHENEVWPLIQDLFRSGLKPPENMDDVQRIGKAAQPLSKLAKEAILRGNEEWRMYLTAEQKRLHDYDLAEMDKTFEQIDRNFEQWTNGEPPEGSLFPPPPRPELGPPRPTKPSEGLPPPEVDVFDPRTIFDTFVEEFIKEYKLNEGQADSARSILAEYKAKANDFRNAKKQELTKIAQEMKTSIEGRDRKRIAAAEVERKKLLAPVYELFGQMENRLSALLTTAQIERHESRSKAVQVRAPKARKQSASVKKLTSKTSTTESKRPPADDRDSE